MSSLSGSSWFRSTRDINRLSACALVLSARALLFVPLFSAVRFMLPQRRRETAVLVSGQSASILAARLFARSLNSVQQLERARFKGTIRADHTLPLTRWVSSDNHVQSCGLDRITTRIKNPFRYDLTTAPMRVFIGWKWASSGVRDNQWELAHSRDGILFELIRIDVTGQGRPCRLQPSLPSSFRQPD